MRTNVPEKLLAIVDDIDAKGDANLTRLTILKKWFERPGRLVPFALWVADRASSRKGKTKGEAADLFREARGLLKGISASQESRIKPQIDRAAAERLCERLRAFQSDYRHDRWGDVRIVHSWQLMLVEKAVEIALARVSSSAAGYKLAADYCQNYDPKYGNTLNGPSRTKILEIVRWMFTHEALEGDSPSANLFRL
jgi:hypothetical protein